MLYIIVDILWFIEMRIPNISFTLVKVAATSGWKARIMPFDSIVKDSITHAALLSRVDQLPYSSQRHPSCPTKPLCWFFDHFDIWTTVIKIYLKKKSHERVLEVTSSYWVLLRCAGIQWECALLGRNESRYHNCTGSHLWMPIEFWNISLNNADQSEKFPRVAYLREYISLESPIDRRQVTRYGNSFYFNSL